VPRYRETPDAHAMFRWVGDVGGVYMEMKMEKKCCGLVATKR
jgi:hypothetical protein